MNKDLHYFGLFNSHNYFPKPNKYVMEINSNEKIVKSTLEAIVIHFTNSIDSLNYNDLNNFFITYRSFTSSNKLLDILLYRFKWSIKSSLDLQFGDNIINDNELIKIYNIIIIRTFIILRHWINNYIIEDFLFNDEILTYFTSFIQNDIYRDLIFSYLDNSKGNDLKLILNCITNLKKVWINKYNLCFDYPHYHISNTSNEYFLKYNIIIDNKKSKKHLSSFALNYSTDPLVRNKSFLDIVGNQINLTKSKNSILYPNNSMLVNQNITNKHHNTTFSRISNKSHTSNDSSNKNKLNFVQSLNVPETSKIDSILPSTPTKNLEFAINFNELMDNESGVRDSIYGLLNKWNGGDHEKVESDRKGKNNNKREILNHEQEDTINSTPDTKSDDNLSLKTPNNVSKFVRYVFSIGKMNGESEDIEEEFQLDGSHKFDILSARSIDEVQFIINNEQVDKSSTLNASTTSDELNYNKMDNLNLYSKVLQITNNLSQSKLNNINLPHTSPKKENFTTSPFLRSIEKTKTQITNRSWLKDNKSNELVFSSQKKSLEIKDINELEVEDESEQIPESPTKAKHKSINYSQEPLKVPIIDKELDIEESQSLSTLDVKKRGSKKIIDTSERHSHFDTTKRVMSMITRQPQRSTSFTMDRTSSSIKNYQSVYSSMKHELPKARNTGRISVSINNRHSSMNNTFDNPTPTKSRFSSLVEGNESDEINEATPINDERNNESKPIAFSQNNGNLSRNVSRKVSVLKSKILEEDDIFKQQEDELNELSLKLSNSTIKRRSQLNEKSKLQDNENTDYLHGEKSIEQISVNSSVGIDENYDEKIIHQPSIPKRFTVGLDLGMNMDEGLVLKSMDKKTTDLREMFKNQMNDNSSDLSFMIYGENDSESFEDLSDHKLDVNPRSFIKDEHSEREEIVFDEMDFAEGDNPLDIAMKKLEGTFEGSDASSDISSKSTKIDLPSSKTIVKSKTMHNLSSNLKRASTLIQNRRQTLLSTTNLSTIIDNNFSEGRNGVVTSPKRLLVDGNSVYYNEGDQSQFNPNNYINDVLMNYRIKDKTLLIDNNEQHIPFILMYSSREIAEQLTLIERDVLNEVDWKSLLQLEMNESLDSYTSWVEVLINQDSLSGVDLGIARFNLTVDWIISEIVLTKDVKLKRNALQKFIHVAEHCIELQNFNTSMQIVLALSSTEVQYFKDSWRLVEPGDMLSWAEMKNLFSSDQDDYKLLRDLMDDMDPIKGCLPFLVLYLSDLKNLHNMSTFFHSNHDIINYKKFDSLSTIVKNFIQRVNWGIEFYSLSLNQQLLSKCLYISSLQQWEIEELLK
ncbi:hypothetical protein ACO0R3_003837 [Hanseniaspora guilliermondii]